MVVLQKMFTGAFIKDLICGDSEYIMCSSSSQDILLQSVGQMD